MAKHKAAPVNFMYAALFVITLLIVVAIIISVRSKKDEDQLTAWATARSSALHSFIQICQQNGGSVDVSPQQPQLIFNCQYANGKDDKYVLPSK